MLEKLKGKYVFFDIDGTLSEFRYNDKLFSDDQIGCQSDVISGLDGENVFILGTVFTNNEAQQKYRWLASNFPNIKIENIIFINRAEIKPLVILEYVKHFNWNISDVIFVDDRLDVLREAEVLGIKSYHPSSFVE